MTVTLTSDFKGTEYWVKAYWRIKVWTQAYRMQRAPKDGKEKNCGNEHMYRCW